MRPRLGQISQFEYPESLGVESIEAAIMQRRVIEKKGVRVSLICPEIHSEGWKRNSRMRKASLIM